MARRTQVQWRALIETQQDSGLTVAEFCRQQKIDAKYFYLRKRQLGKAISNFVKVKPSDLSFAESTTQNIKLKVIDVELPVRGSSESGTLSLLLDRLLG
ncbi:MAG: IS66 family insertion sequence element accessory protein TnpB [Gammaproteobacteria bacterium]|nr:IS66 family insertion sequence element accessory protein TnpB [Gammaproteobacteria bacterium]